MQQSNTHNLPNVFRDSLELRAKNLRFRGVGNPYAFLTELGLTPIKEFLYRGATLIDLAETLNLPLTILRNWIEDNSYQAEIEEAGVISAEGYLALGERMLREADTKFALDKAKQIIEHGRWMASKKDKKQFGNAPDVQGGPAAVSYVFNVNANGPVQLNASHAAEQLEDYKAPPTKDVDYSALNQLAINLDADAPETLMEELVQEINTFDLGPIPSHIKRTDKPTAKVAPLRLVDTYER